MPGIYCVMVNVKVRAWTLPEAGVARTEMFDVPIGVFQ